MLLCILSLQTFSLARWFFTGFILAWSAAYFNNANLTLLCNDVIHCCMHCCRPMLSLHAQFCLLKILSGLNWHVKGCICYVVERNIVNSTGAAIATTSLNTRPSSSSLAQPRTKTGRKKYRSRKYSLFSRPLKISPSFDSRNVRFAVPGVTYFPPRVVGTGTAIPCVSHPQLRLHHTTNWQH